MPYIILIDTMCDGVVPSVRNGNGHVIVFCNRRAAESEVADHMITQYQQVIDGDADKTLDDVDADEWVEEVEIDGFGRLARWPDETYAFDEDSAMAVRTITNELELVTSKYDVDDLPTPYDIVEATSLDGWFVNLITRYTKDGNDVVGWGIEQHNPDNLITDEVEVLDAGTMVAFVDWLRAR